MNTKELMRRIMIAIMSSALIMLLVVCGSAEQRMTFTYPQDNEETQSTEPQEDDEADSDEIDDGDSEEDSELETDGDAEEDEDEEYGDAEEDNMKEVNQGANAILKRYARLMETLTASDAEDEEAEEEVEASNETDADEGLTDEEYAELEKTCIRIQEIYNAVFGGDNYVTNQVYRARVAPYEEELDELESKMLELAAKAGWEINPEDGDFDDDSGDSHEYKDHD